MRYLGRRIKYARVTKGASQEALADDIGKDWRTVARYEQGRLSPPLSVLELIAAATGVDVSWLVMDEPPPEGPSKSRRGSLIGQPQSFAVQTAGREPSRSVAIPLLAQVPAGPFKDAVTSSDEMVDVPAGWMRGRTSHVYALRAEGMSMEPQILDGDILVIHKQETAENGDIVVASVQGSSDVDEFTVKKLRQAGQTRELRSVNRAHPHPVDRPFKIQGKVIGLIRALAV